MLESASSTPSSSTKNNSSSCQTPSSNGDNDIITVHTNSDSNNSLPDSIDRSVKETKSGPDKVILICSSDEKEEEEEEEKVELLTGTYTSKNSHSPSVYYDPKDDQDKGNDNQESVVDLKCENDTDKKHHIDFIVIKRAPKAKDELFLVPMSSTIAKPIIVKTSPPPAATSFSAASLPLTPTDDQEIDQEIDEILYYLPKNAPDKAKAPLESEPVDKKKVQAGQAQSAVDKAQAPTETGTYWFIIFMCSYYVQTIATNFDIVLIRKNCRM